MTAETGDQFEILSRRLFFLCIHFIGRNDDIIKSSGYRIGPYEVESAVLSHESVSNCAITAYPDEIRFYDKSHN